MAREHTSGEGTMFLRISSHCLCWLLGSADGMHNTTQQFCGLKSEGATILVLLRFEGAPISFTSTQPLNSKRYDPFLKGNQRTALCVLSDDQRRNYLYIYFAIHCKLLGILSFRVMQMQQNCFFICRNQ